MSGQFWFGGNNGLTFTPGGMLGSGAFTIALLAAPSGNCHWLGGVSGANADLIQLTRDTNNLFGNGDFSAGWPSQTNGTWQIAAICKPSGAAHYRYHSWAYAADGSGTMTHGEPASEANHANMAALASIQLGAGASSPNGINGAVAVCAMWDRALSDTEMDSLKSGHLSAWAALTPKFLMDLQNWNQTTNTGDRIDAGTSTRTSMVGSIDTIADPPSFDFALTGGSNTATLSGKVPVLTGSLSATVINPASLSGAVPVLTGTDTGTVINPAVLSGSVPLLTGPVFGSETNPAVLVGSVPVVTGIISGQSRNPASLAGSVPVLTGQTLDQTVNVGIMVGQLPSLTGEFIGGPKNPAVLNSKIPLLTGTIRDFILNRVNITIEFGPTRSRSQVDVGSTRSRAQASVGGTRSATAAEVGPTRGSITIGPTRS